MGIFGGPLEIAGAFLQGQPSLPQFTPLNPQLEQSKAIQGNLAELPTLESLAGQINTFTTSQIDKMLETAMPWYNQVRNQVGGILQSELSGQIPQDVQQQIQDTSAARAIGGGYAGSGVHGDLVARDLGLTSLALTQQGITSSQQWITAMNNIYSRGMFDVTSMFISPQQQYAMDEQQAGLQFQHDWAQNIMDWQKSPGYIIGGQLQESGSELDQIGMSVIESYLGGGIGGMMGGAKAAPAGGGGGGGASGAAGAAARFGGSFLGSYG